MAKSRGKRGVSKANARRADAAAEAKASETEVRKAGEPSLPLPKRADILEAINEVKGWNAKMETIKAKRELVFKAYKAKHVSSQLIKELIALERGDQDAYRQYLDSLAIGLKAVNAPFQLNVFDISYGSDIDEARAKATQHASAGKSAECRFQEGSPAHDAYMETYAAVQARMAPGADALSDDQIDEAVRSAAPPASTPQLEMAH